MEQGINFLTITNDLQTINRVVSISILANGGSVNISNGETNIDLPDGNALTVQANDGAYLEPLTITAGSGVSAICTYFL